MNLVFFALGVVMFLTSMIMIGVHVTNRNGSGTGLVAAIIAATAAMFLVLNNVQGVFPDV